MLFRSGNENQGGISSVKVPTDPQQDPKQCLDWTTIDDPPEVIAAISDRLKKHFGQSKNCTWTSPPLDFTMQFEGTGDIADAILTGTYDTSQAPTEAARWVIEALKYAAGSTEADKLRFSVVLP